MARRRRAPKRNPIADPKYNSLDLSRFINKIMVKGKKTTAQRIVYQALNHVENDARRPPLEVFDQAIKNATPMVEVKSRRVGGSTYQVPIEIRGERRTALAFRWLICVLCIFCLFSNSCWRIKTSIATNVSIMLFR